MKRTCPNCLHELTEDTPLTGKEDCKPKTGDITVCIGCGIILIYGEKLQLTEAPPNVIKEVMKDKKAAHALSMAVQWIKEKNANN